VNNGNERRFKKKKKNRGPNCASPMKMGREREGLEHAVLVAAILGNIGTGHFCH